VSDRLPSLELIHASFERERDRDLAHFDALDTKAGVIVGFAGVLVTIQRGTGWIAILGALVGVGAAFTGLAAFWPGRFPTLEPSHLRSYLTSEERITTLALVDTYLDLLEAGRDLIRTKALRLKVAVILLAVSAAIVAFS
jgi:hypothetical protein